MLTQPTTRELSRYLMQLRQPTVAVNVALVAAVAGCWLVSYWDTLVSLVYRWDTDSNYSHGYLVPAVSLYLVYQNRGKNNLASTNRFPWDIVGGGMLVVFGLALRYVTVVMPSLVAECFSMLTVLAGLVLLLGGRNGWRRCWAGLLFLVFMVPWPSALYSRLAFPLQLLVSQTAAAMFEACGIPVLRDGNLIHLPRQTMHVAEACSGLRQLTAFLAICTCAALLLQRPMWYRVFVLASAIPIAVAINVLRVTGTGLMLQYGDPEWTKGTLHTLEGLIMVALGMGLLMLELALLDWLLEGKPGESVALEPRSHALRGNAV